MSDTDGSVTLELRGSTAFVTFDRRGARNAMTWSMYAELGRTLDAVASDDTVRVAVFRGAGGHFVAGTDIAQFVAFESGEDGIAYERRLEGVIAKLESLAVATVAVVEGYAVGGGLALAAACDLRICSPDARFGVPIAKTVGNCLSMANCARLMASLGAARTTELLFTAEAMRADEARALGFVMSVVSPEDLDAAVDALCSRLASHAPITLQVTKEAIHRLVAEHSVDGDDLIRRAYGSRDFREGVAAFVAKRVPRWEGR